MAHNQVSGKKQQKLVKFNEFVARTIARKKRKP